MGYRLFEALNMMGWLVATVLLPYFSRMTSVGQNVQPLLRTASIMLFVFSAIPAIVATLFPEILLGFFYQNSIEPAAVILPGLIIAFAFVAQSFVFSTLLTAQGQLRILIRLALAGTVVNIGLNTYWIPEYGGLGCAWSSALTQGAVLIAQVAIVLRQQRHASWWRWVRALLTYTFLSAIIIGVWVRWGEESTGQLLLVTAALAFASLTPGVVAWRQVRATFSASDRPQ
jgi:O-antigen/teichoic acid export membrane protein